MRLSKQVLSVFLLLFITSLFCTSRETVYLEFNDLFFENEFSLAEPIEILTDNDAYTEIEFNLPRPEYILNDIDGEHYLRIYHPAADYLMEEGYPELPYFSTLIAIPNTGEVFLEELSTSNLKIIRSARPFPSQGFDVEICDEKGFLKNTQFYNSNEIYPSRSTIIGSPAILRDFRVVPLTFQPYSYDPATREITVRQNITVRINYNQGRSGENEITSPRRLSRSFETTYRSRIANYDTTVDRNQEYQHRSMIVIYPNTTNPQYLNVVNEFVDWKRRKGFHIVSTSTQGMSTNIQIKSYIQNAYNTWEHPPEYVVLMGATSGTFSIPAWNMGSPGGTGDHNYTTLSGNDILSDVFIGRFPVTSAYQLQTMWNKQMNYEMYPYMADTNWYNRGVLAASGSTSSGISIVYVTRYIRDQMLVYNPDYDITVINTGDIYSQIISAMNQGVMTFAFRGFMMSGWNPSQLNNGYMLPNCFLVTCYTYNNAVDMVLAGTPATPNGAVTAVGLSTGSTKTAFNNILITGFYYGMYVDGARSIGEIHHLGKLHMYNVYANAHYNEMTNFFHWSNLFGDPSMDIWLGEPKEMNVEYPAEVLYGANYIPVQVTDESGNPVENAWVTIRKGTNNNEDVFVTGYTDSNGHITLYHDPVTGEIDITVTKPDYHPHLGSFEISDTGTVSFEDIVFGDELEAGNTSDFVLILKNYSAETVENLAGTLTSDSEYITIIDETSTFTTIPPNQTGESLESFSVNVSTNAPDFYKAVFDLELTDSVNEWTTRFQVNVSGSKIEISQIMFAQNEIINPGETANMHITLTNNGSVDLLDIHAELSAANPHFLINNNLTFYGDLPAGQENTPMQQYLNVTAMAQLLPGMQVQLELEIYNDSGFQQIIPFNIQVGNPTVTDPLGPDAYGYWCYDDGDTDYMDAPVYEWIEIFPGLGGAGSNTGLTADFHNNQGVMTMDLPFTFRFYGIDYDEISICANGWVSFGYVDYATQRNGRLPGPLGPMPIIAAFWDNLSLAAGGVYTYHDQEQNTFIIQWQNAQNVVGNAENTFQIILYNPIFYPIFDGNGPIKIQYKVFNNLNNAGASPHGNWGKYCTVGIADHTNTIGLEYTFNNQYPPAARVLSNESAIYFTGPPISYDDDFLVLSQINIHDDNNYGFIYEGEVFSLNINAINYGQSTSQNLSGILSSSSNSVEIYNSSSDFTDIPSGLTGMNTEYFTLSVVENVPDNTVIPFTIELMSDTGSWEYQFNLPVRKPGLLLASYIINDSAGNNDGVADPGEDIKMIFNLKNPSELPAENIEVILTTDNPHITIPQDLITIPLLPPALDLQAVFDVELSASTPPQSPVLFNVTINADNVSEISNSVSLGVSISPEILEENFNQWLPNGWSIDAHSANWSQSSTSNAGGSPPEARMSFSPSFIGISRLISRPISLMGATNVSLEFKHHVNNFSGGYTLGVATRSNGGDWTTIWDVNVNSDIPAQTMVIPFDNDDLHNPDFQVCWYLSGDSWGLNYWYIDDVIIHATLGNSAKIEGNVSLLSSDYEIENVIVSTENYGTNPDSGGNYTLYVNAGSYDYLQAWLPYHNIPYYSDLEVDLGDILEDYDFELSFLQPPTELTGVYYGGNSHLSWNYNLTRTLQSNHSRSIRYREELEHFNVYRQHFTGVFQFLGSTLDTHFSDPIEPGNRYSYFVRAQYSTVESLPTETVTLMATSLAPPINLTANIIETQGILLNWDAPVLEPLRSSRRSRSRDEEIELLGYRVYKNDSVLTEIEDPESLEYLDTETPAVMNVYYVTAMYSQGESAASNSVEVILLFPPSGLTASVGDMEIMLSWEAPDYSGFTRKGRTLQGYNLYRNEAILNSDLILETEFTDTEVINGALFSYQVTAVYSQGESEGSEPLEITLFGAPENLEAEAGDEIVELFWDAPVTSFSRANRSLLGYNVYRDELQVNSEILTDTLYIDTEVENHVTYSYYVTAVYTGNESEPSNIVEATPLPDSDTVDVNPPAITRLKGNYPNPFNPDTNIHFSLSDKSYVRLDIYNILGQNIRNLVAQSFNAGGHIINWNGKDNNGNSVGSGIYFYKMQTENYRSIRKMILLK